MSSEGYLFVTEDLAEHIRDAIGEEFEIEVPPEWDTDILSVPDEGEARILNSKEEEIGKVRWRVKFRVERDEVGRYVAIGIDWVEVETKRGRLRIEC